MPNVQRDPLIGGLVGMCWEFVLHCDSRHYQQKIKTTVHRQTGLA